MTGVPTQTPQSPAQIGPYTVERELGRGGMGVVYLADDPRLGRKVAIKVMAPELAKDQQHVARLEREARTLAALSHPNIAAVHGVERVGADPCVVLEYVEGLTLAEMLDAGPLPVDEALRVCSQIAAGVSAAHDAGIVHRDLKPANVKITADGRVKVLDFGLAKEAGTRTTISPGDPTLPQTGVTVPGMVMGTPGYMSPEQARGRSVDRRTDVFAWGCTLYECLTGRRAFAGETSTDMIAAILEREPDLKPLPSRTPARVRELLRHCLEKDPHKRLRDLGDARLEIERALDGREWMLPTGAHAAVRGGLGKWGLAAVIGVAGIAAGVAGGVWMLPRKAATVAVQSPAAAPVTRTTIVLPESMAYDDGDLAISHDGRVIAYLSGVGDAKGMRDIFVRALDAYEPRKLKGTHGARSVCFSPDGEWLAFAERDDATTRSKLNKIRVSGGPAITLCERDDSETRGVQWTGQGTILFVGGRNRRTIFEVPAEGGEPTVRYQMGEEDSGDVLQGLSPVGATGKVLFNQGITNEKGYYHSLFMLEADGKKRVVLERGAFGRYLNSGHLLFARENVLLAAPFDADKGEITGGVVPVLEGLSNQAMYDSDAWVVSENGVLAYIGAGPSGVFRTIVRVDAKGQVSALPMPAKMYEASVVASPDGRKIAGMLVGPRGAYEIFIYDTQRDAFDTFDLPGADCIGPAWTPDGERIVFGTWSSSRNQGLYVRRVDGSDNPTPLLAEAERIGYFPSHVSPDGRWVLASRGTGGSAELDLVLVPLDGSGNLVEAAVQAGEQYGGRFSPDGRWIAYCSTESGKAEALVQRVPDATTTGAGAPRKWRVSGRVANACFWAPDGKAIRLTGESGDVFEVGFTAQETDAAPQFSAARELFTLNRREIESPLDLMPDGEHMLYIQSAKGESGSTTINVVQNWTEELKTLVPGARGATP